jgi:hypothetical protein
MTTLTIMRILPREVDPLKMRSGRDCVCGMIGVLMIKFAGV